MSGGLVMSYARAKYLRAIIVCSVFGLGGVGALAAPFANVAMIAAGDTHTCALSTAGGVKCWGDNFTGQLGSNSTVTPYTPVDVAGLSSGVASIAAGYYHSCAITTAGVVKCWGGNSGGQLGDNSYTSRSTAMNVTGLASGVTAVAAGEYHSCALTAVGGVKCWGDNSYGQLGDNTATARLTPVDVVGLGSGVVAVAAGRNHSCALTAAGGVKCWGYAINGQIGDGGVTNRLAPVAVTGLGSGVVAIAAGNYHSCAVTSSGGAYCWGYNFDGELGDNTNVSHLAPVAVSGLANGAVAIAAGYFHTCALNSAGAVKCWGRNDSGQLGDNSTTNRLTPVSVTGLASGVTALALGGYHSCALTTASGVKCWGYNMYGQLGDNSLANRLMPVDVIVAISPPSCTLSASPISITIGGTSTLTATCNPAASAYAWSDAGCTSAAASCTVRPTANASYTVIASNSAGAGNTASATVTVTSSALGAPYVGLWWNPDESGWGMSVTQHGNMIFNAFYTYDPSGNPTWYVMSNCPLTGSNCTGDIYQVVGGTPMTQSWNGANKLVTKVGSGTLNFFDANDGIFNFTINGALGSKVIARQVWLNSGTAANPDYTDLWWNASESGWGVALTQQFGVIFAALYSYDGSGKAIWYVASSCVVAGNACSGSLYQVNGGSPLTGAWSSANKTVATVGTVSFAFSDATNGIMNYSINGVNGSRSITRQSF